MAQDVRYFRQGGGPPCRAALHSGEGSYRSIYRIPSERAGCRSSNYRSRLSATNVDVNRQVEFVEQHVGLPEGMTRDEMAHHAGVPETAMRDFLDGLRRAGAGMGYLREIGIGEDTFDAVGVTFGSAIGVGSECAGS